MGIDRDRDSGYEKHREGPIPGQDDSGQRDSSIDKARTIIPESDTLPPERPGSGGDSNDAGSS